MSDPSASKQTVPDDHLTKEDDDLISKMPMDGEVYTKSIKIGIIDRELYVVMTKDGQITGKTPLARAIAHDIGTIAQFNVKSDDPQAGNDDDKKQPAAPSFLDSLQATPSKQTRQSSKSSSSSSNDGDDPPSDDTVFCNAPEQQLDTALSKLEHSMMESLLEGWDTFAVDQCTKARKHWGHHDCDDRCLMFECYFFDRVQNCRRGTKSERKTVLKDHLIPQFFLEAAIPIVGCASKRWLLGVIHCANQSSQSK